MKSLIILKLLLFFLAGLLFAFLVNIDLPKFFFTITLLGAILSLIVFNSIKVLFQHRVITGIVVSLLMFMLGVTKMAGYQSSFEAPTELSIPKSVFALRLTTAATPKAKSTQYLAEVLHHKINELNGQKLMLYVSNDEQSVFAKNDTLFVNGSLNRIAKPQNPHSFNYQKFMNQRGVYFQTYLPKDSVLEVRPTTQQQTNIIEHLKNFCFNFIEQNIAPEQQGIAKALLIGYKNELSQEVSNQFQNSGTMHILAVSGLHVGIIYLVLLQLLTFFKKTFRLPKPVIISVLLIGIWLFALLTGGKASVIRAATMFSLFAVGKELYPSTNSLNILATTAFGMLLVNPFYLFDVGFQLSFSAVFGILTIMPLFKRFYTGNKLADYFIGITAVSFAAQVATLPLSMFYFHIYPTYSLLANFLAIPLATCIVSVGFVGVLLSKIPLVSKAFGFAVTWFIKALEWNNQFFSTLEFAVVDNIYLTPLQVVLLTLSVYLVVFHFKTKKNKLLFAGLGLALFLMGLVTINKLTATQTNKTYIYAINKHLVIDEIKGRNSTLYLQKELPKELYTFNISGNHRANYIKDTTQQLINNDVVFIGYNSIQLVNKQTKQFKLVDYYLLTEPTNTLLQQEYLKDKKVIVVNRRRPDYLQLSEQFHFLQSDGYYKF